MQTTTNYNLKKPSTTDNIIIADLNENVDIIDNQMKTNATDITTNKNNLASHLTDNMYQKATGTATAITVTTQTLVNGYAKTFVVSANNNGSATTINAIPLYKPSTTIAPNLIAGKAVTVWYNLASNCFFIKASAEGTADIASVLAGKTFSNDIDTGLMGTMPNNGAVTITPSTNNQTIVQGYHNGSGVVNGDTDLIPSNILSSANIFGIAGSFVNPLVPGNTYISLNHVEQETNSAVMQLLKSTHVSRGGTYRVSHTARGSGGSGIRTQIYVNGVARGTLRQNPREQPVTYTEDITVVDNDTIQVYGYDYNGVYTAYAFDLNLGIAMTFSYIQ